MIRIMFQLLYVSI